MCVTNFNNLHMNKPLHSLQQGYDGVVSKRRADRNAQDSANTVLLLFLSENKVEFSE